jgi:Rps23 Pro-64 3,4-dihydroxylase Tpa1-like proline 4-hydroxylase
MKDVEAAEVVLDVSADLSSLEPSLLRKSYGGLRIWTRPDPKYLIRLKEDEDKKKEEEKKKRERGDPDQKPGDKQPTGQPKPSAPPKKPGDQSSSSRFAAIARPYGNVLRHPSLPQARMGRSPISPTVLREHSALREAFQSDDLLPQFAAIPNFLRRSVAREIRTVCERGHYATFCAYSTPDAQSDLHNEFCEPNNSDVYVTIHKRLRAPVPRLVQFDEVFRSRETIQELAAITGLRLTRALAPGVLTYWPPGGFLEAHTDHSEETEAKLVLSISLSGRWHASYGGATVYAWGRMDRTVRLQPQLNTAVLFTPFPGSWHWVEQVSEKAPPLRRFTWTVFFS